MPRTLHLLPCSSPALCLLFLLVCVCSCCWLDRQSRAYFPCYTLYVMWYMYIRSSASWLACKQRRAHLTCSHWSIWWLQLHSTTLRVLPSCERQCGSACPRWPRPSVSKTGFIQDNLVVNEKTYSHIVYCLQLPPVCAGLLPKLHIHHRRCLLYSTRVWPCRQRVPYTAFFSCHVKLTQGHMQTRISHVAYLFAPSYAMPCRQGCLKAPSIGWSSGTLNG